MPQRHVEGRMLAAEKPCDPRAVLAPRPQRKQQQRPAFPVIGDNDEGPDAFARPDLTLPCDEKIETLIRRAKLTGLFEGAPDRLRLAHVADEFDPRDTARL